MGVPQSGLKDWLQTPLASAMTAALHSLSSRQLCQRRLLTIEDRSPTDLAMQTKLNTVQTKMYYGT
eukprot:490017-Amphidinium_carterae.1